jgi:hypothetical protein
LEAEEEEEEEEEISVILRVVDGNSREKLS